MTHLDQKRGIIAWKMCIGASARHYNTLACLSPEGTINPAGNKSNDFNYWIYPCFILYIAFVYIYI